MALAADELQYEHGYGPCIDAGRGGVSSCGSTTCETEERWPDYVAHVRADDAGPQLAVGPAALPGLVHRRAEQLLDRSPSAFAVARFAGGRARGGRGRRGRGRQRRRALAARRAGPQHAPGDGVPRGHRAGQGRAHGPAQGRRRASPSRSCARPRSATTASCGTSPRASWTRCRAASAEPPGPVAPQAGAVEAREPADQELHRGRAVHGLGDVHGGRSPTRRSGGPPASARGRRRGSVSTTTSRRTVPSVPGRDRLGERPARRAPPRRWCRRRLRAWSRYCWRIAAAWAPIGPAAAKRAIAVLVEHGRQGDVQPDQHRRQPGGEHRLRRLRVGPDVELGGGGHVAPARRRNRP